MCATQPPQRCDSCGAVSSGPNTLPDCPHWPGPNVIYMDEYLASKNQNSAPPAVTDLTRWRVTHKPTMKGEAMTSPYPYFDLVPGSPTNHSIIVRVNADGKDDLTQLADLLHAVVVLWQERDESNPRSWSISTLDHDVFNEREDIE